MPCGRGGEMRSDNQQIAVGAILQQRLAGKLCGGLVEIRRAAPIGSRHLYRVVNAIPGDQGLLPAGADVYADVTGGMTRGGLEANLFADLVGFRNQVHQPNTFFL